MEELIILRQSLFPPYIIDLGVYWSYVMIKVNAQTVEKYQIF